MVTEILGGAPYPYRKEKETHGLIVIVASGIARGRVCTTATAELPKMAGIIEPLG